MRPRSAALRARRLHGTVRTLTRSLSADRVFVVGCSICIAFGVTLIGACMVAAFALAEAVTVQIPLVATFHGFVSEQGSNAVSISGSWGGALGVVLLLAAPLCMVAIGYRDEES